MTEIAGLIEQTLGLTALPGPTWQVDQRRHGPFAPLTYAASTPQGWHLVSSPLTQTEWWTTFIPTTLCPRYSGKLGIEDYYEAFCRKEACAAACGAEDGFVELRANRFRLDADAALMAQRFPHLHRFLDRAERLVASANQTRGMGWQFTRTPQMAYLQIVVPEAYLASHLQGLAELFPLATGIDAQMDVESLPPFDMELIDIDEEPGLMATARHFAGLATLRRATEFFFANLIAERGGEANGFEFKLPTGLRYLITTHVECYQGETGYMGRIEFQGGLGEIRKFVATTIGGGRW